MVSDASNRDRRHSAPVNPTPRKRRHPSKKSRAGALALSVAATGGLSYVVATSASAAATTAAPLTSASIDTTTAAATSAGATGATLSTTPAASTKLATPTASTTINGAVFANKYGDVQVQVVFAADGSLSAVNVLQSPNGDNKSVSINARALPVLNSEALAAQKANVYTVSGAMYTTNGYVSSLQSAIDMARARGITTLASMPAPSQDPLAVTTSRW